MGHFANKRSKSLEVFAVVRVAVAVVLDKRTARCDAATGEFLLSDVAPGAYKLRLRSGRFERTLTVYVNSAATTYLGAIPTASFKLLPLTLPKIPFLR